MKEAADDFSQLEKKEANITDLAKLFEKTTAVQTTALENMAPVLPEQNQPMVEKALISSQRGMDRAAQILGEPPVPIDLLARLNSLRGQGLISQEETTNLLQVKNREEARGLFRNFVEQGLIPNADLKRFDSSQAKYFSNDFSKAVEMYKFKELINLEKQPVSNTDRKKLEEFAKTYQPGNIVPPELRNSWSRTIRLEEMQKTISPDKLDDKVLQKNPQFFEKFQEIRDRVRPTADEAKFAEEYLKNNPDKELPPEINRIISLKDKFGVVKTGERPPPGHQEATFLPASVMQFKEIPYQNQDFRQPFNLPSPPANQPGQPSPSYQPYQQQGQGQYVPPPVQNQNQGQSGQQTSPNPSSCPSGSYWNGSTCQFPPSQSNQPPSNPPPPSGQNSPPPNQPPPNNPPPQNNPPPNNPPPNNPPADSGGNPPPPPPQ